MVEEILYKYSLETSLHWKALGRENNRGTVEAAGDPVRSAVERVTNAIDGILEFEHDLHHGQPDCRTPFEAARSWLSVPIGGLSAMSTSSRQSLADRVTVVLKDGSGKNERLLEIRDSGSGISPNAMSSTILSLNESNKLQKFYLAGAYGQGGSSTFAFCKYTLIATRSEGQDIGFTIVKYDHLNPDKFKTGHYVYLTDSNGQALTSAISSEDFPRGTVVRHFGFDLSSYPSPLGPYSLYGALNTNLFDPVLPIWLDSSINKGRRVIKGSRNALNGAIDSGDAAKGPELSHKMPMFTVSLGGDGSIGIEYWVLPGAEKAGAKPSAAFVNPTHPVILTLNGQNHAEFTNHLTRKAAQLPFLTNRLICHIDCNGLSGNAKRQMFVSNREGGRDVRIRELIRSELVKTLTSDDVLLRLNDEARQQGTEQKDANALKQMRGEVAKLLQMHGVDISASSTSGSQKGGDGEPPKPRPPRPPKPPILEKEPPSFIRIVWDEDRPVSFYPQERRYLRIETDAPESYYSADLGKSRVNLILPKELSYKGSTRLAGGRMRFIVQANDEAEIGTTGTLQIELSRVGLPILSDARHTLVVKKPEEKGKGIAVQLPQFEVIAVRGLDDPRWAQLGWNTEIEKTASETSESDGLLTIYYSTVFPRFATTLAKLEAQSAVSGASFTRRYEVWIAAHSLLLYRDQQEASGEDVEDDETSNEAECAERRRLAVMATLMATREVKDMIHDQESE